MKVFVIAHLPDDAVAHLYLRHIRAFDLFFEGCHFEIAAEAPDMSLHDVVEMLKADPALEISEIFERKKQ